MKDIYEFIEDQDGAMWFATSVGAARLEGDQWTFLGDDNNLAKNPLTDIAKGPDGALWFGWKGGLIRFDGTIWTAYTKTNGLLDNDVSDIAIDPQGVVWVSSAKGMSRFDGRNWRTYQENDHYIFANGGPACLAIAPDGSVWGSQKYHGIINIRGDTIRAYFLQGVLSRFSPAIDAIGVGADGKVWVVTDGSGIFWFDGSQWSNFTLVLGLGDPYEGGFPGGGPVLRGPDGAVWMGNWFYGVIRYDGSWWQMNWSGGLRDEWIVSVDSADDGAMWFATKYGGVSRFDGTHWKTYELSVNEYPTKIRTMATGMNEDVWISTENSLGSDARGLFRLRNGSWSYLTTKNKPGTDNIISIVRTSDGNMWFGTYADGVWRHDGNTWTNYTVENGLAGNRVNGMAAGPDGTLWAATDKGVSRYDGATWKSFTKQNGLPYEFIHSIGVDLEGLVYASADNVVVLYNGENWKTAFTTGFQSPYTSIRSIAAGPDGSIWFGTSNGDRDGEGILRYINGGVTVYQSRDGLAGDRVGSIVVGSDLAMWFGTNHGVSRLDWSNSPM